MSRARCRLCAARSATAAEPPAAAFARAAREPPPGCGGPLATARQGPRRGIRSYSIRSGRITDAQRRALIEHWPRYGLSVADGLLDWEAAFGRSAARALDIGFGMGEALLEQAVRMPERDFVGVDVYPPGVGSLLRAAAAAGLENVRAYREAAELVIERCVADRSLDSVQLFFPDPWPKKRHHKRRLVQPALVRSLRDKLRPGGVLHLASDWEHLAEHMLATVHADGGFRNLAADGGFVPRPPERPYTRFERRGIARGHRVRDLMFARR